MVEVHGMRCEHGFSCKAMLAGNISPHMLCRAWKVSLCISGSRRWEKREAVTMDARGDGKGGAVAGDVGAEDPRTFRGVGT